MRPRVLLLALAATIVSTSCGPTLLWYGHDPARTTRWELRSGSGRSWLQAPSGRRSQDYDEVVVAELVFAPGGARFAVPVRRGARWFMLVDLVEGPASDGLAAARFSEDGRHLAYAAEQGGRWRVLLDGQAGPTFDGVVAGTMAFGPGGARLGYAAIDGACVRVVAAKEPPVGCHQRVRALFVGDTAAADRVLVEDHGVATLVEDRKTHPIVGLSAFAFDAHTGRWAAATRSAPRARLLVEGETLEEGDEIAHLRFSPAGQLARAVRDHDTWRFALDDKRNDAYRFVGAPVFSASGRRYGYVAGGADGRAVVVIDGAARAVWSAADGLVFSADERRVAYAVRSGTQTGIVCDDRVFPFDVVIETSIGFSADGRHWGALVGDRRRHHLSIVVDGQRYLPFDSEELFGAAASDAVDLRGLRGWVVAELEHDLRRGTR